MPHQCTSCGRTFADGSKEMLSGCPDCGGNKFQFMPAEAVDGDPGGSGGRGATNRARDAGGTAPKKRPDDAPSTADASSGGDAPETGGDRGAVNRAAATVREWVGSGGSADDRTGEHAGSADGRESAGSADGRASAKPANGQEHAEPADQATGGAAETPEDSAQASARRDVVTEDELPEDSPETAASASDAGATGRPVDAPDDSTPSASSADDRTPSASSADDSTRQTPADSAGGDSPPAESADVDVTGEAASADASDGAEVVDAPDDRNPGLEELREELNSQFESIRIENPGQYELNLMELYEREEYIISLQEDGKYVIEVPDAWDAVDR